MTDDILANFSDQDIQDTVAYHALIDLLNEVKLVHGGEGLKSTLSRHKKIMVFLRSHQKKLMIELLQQVAVCDKGNICRISFRNGLMKTAGIHCIPQHDGHTVKKIAVVKCHRIQVRKFCSRNREE